MKQNFTLLKSSTIILLGAFAMGNTKCEQPLANKRELKKNVRVLDINASSFLDNSGFNFSEVARSQYSGVLFEKNHFYERNIYPDLNEISGSSDQRYFNVQKTSGDSATAIQLKTWFPTMKSREISLDRDSSCLMMKPQHFIKGKINSLEAHSGGKLQFGFSQNYAQIPISANFSLDRMRMDLSFHAIDPWSYEVVDSQNSEAFKTDYKVGAGIDFGGIFHVGPEFYRITGMAEVTLKGLQAATEKLANSLLSKPGEVWNTRIVYSRDNYVAVLGGAELGLKKGDRLKVFNEAHTWHGEPCGESSVLAGSLVVSDASDPWIIEIEEPGKLLSRARVLNIKENESINTGALVKLHQFVEDVKSAQKTAAK